jgi:hypothetical protein
MDHPCGCIDSTAELGAARKADVPERMRIQMREMNPGKL